jgi:hypothetical protein
MARLISSKTKSKKPDHGGDTAPLTPIAKAIGFHPIAEKFPLIEGEEFDRLVEDVRANGLAQPIVLYQGKIIDGRNRYRACRKAGVEPKFATFPGGDPVTYVISLNLRRRHLKPEKREELLIELIKLNPTKSDREHGKDAGFDHKTVAKARKKGEDVGKIPHVETRIDTRGRRVPAKKSATKSKSMPPAKLVGSPLTAAEQIPVRNNTPVLTDAGVTAPGLLPSVPVTDRRAQHTIVNGEPSDTHSSGRPLSVSEQLVRLVWYVDKTEPAEIARKLRDQLDPAPIEKLFKWLDQIRSNLEATP